MKELREAIAPSKYLDPLKELRESAAALKYVDPMKELREAMAPWKHVDPMKALRDTMAALTRHPLEDMRVLYDAAETAASMWRDASTQQTNAPVNAEVVNDLDGEAVDARVTQVIEKVRSEGELAAALQVLIAEIRALKSSRLQIIMVSLVLPIIIGLLMAIVQPFANYYIVRALGDGKKSASPVTSQTTSSSTSRLYSSGGLRLVRPGGALVRLRPKKHAQATGRVGAGEVVILIRKQKHWAFIAFTHAGSGVTSYGWVSPKRLDLPK